MKKKAFKTHISGVVALLLFVVFAACVTIVLLTGAKAYRRITERDRLSANRRACMQYIATKVHQNDFSDSISIENFGGTDALVINGDDYITRIYCKDGSLTELYTTDGMELSPEDGEKILDIYSLKFKLDKNTLTVTAAETEDAVPASLTLALLSKEAAE